MAWWRVTQEEVLKQVLHLPLEDIVRAILCEQYFPDKTVMVIQIENKMEFSHHPPFHESWFVVNHHGLT